MLSRRQFLIRSAGAAAVLCATPAMAADVTQREPERNFLLKGWQHPSRSYRPHTRWWWPNSAVTREGIRWQLEQMREKGMGGVEIMASGGGVPGGIDYLSDQWLEMVRYTIETARGLDLEVAITMGPGWSFGGSWVPVTERSKVLACGWKDLEGPGVFDGELPDYARPAKESQHESAIHEPDWVAPDARRVLAVVAGRLEGDRLVGDSLQVLRGEGPGNTLRWEYPAGQWRLMAFRLLYTGQICQAQHYQPTNWVADHFNPVALRNNFEHLGGAFYRAFGDEFGKTVDSLFCDSFEIYPLPGTLLWSNGLLALFQRQRGYDLTPNLPAIWFEIGEKTPRVRYDINEFLHQAALDITFREFVGWCDRHGIEARIQPHYRFTEELIQGSGAAPRPETEATPKRFEVLTEPRKATVAGARFYGRKIVSAEAYTYFPPGTTLQELKIATDGFLRDGITQFYNHGYVYSPEKRVTAASGLITFLHINHWNTWWKYYDHLAHYISRSCFLLRQGEFAGDVLLYSPQATVWTEEVPIGEVRRLMPYGNLGKLLVANGYEFDPVNDDVLQNRARVEEGRVRVREGGYRFLLLPKIRALPLKTMEFLYQFVQGGGVLIGLDRLPEFATGMKDYPEGDERIRSLVRELFGEDDKGRQHPRGGATYFLPECKVVPQSMNPMQFFSQTFVPTPPLSVGEQRLIEILRSHVRPDFELEGGRQSDGLTFLHRRHGETDIYFVTNLQAEAVRTWVTFRVTDKYPEQWDPMTGVIKPAVCWRREKHGIAVAISLEASASTFLLFRSGPAPAHVTQTNLAEINSLNAQQVQGVAEADGHVQVEVEDGGRRRSGIAEVTGLPAPLPLAGEWMLTLEPQGKRRLARLTSWNDDPATKHFSGAGRYELEFDLPPRYLSPDLELWLDLGKVGCVAEVQINGMPAGLVWMSPYRVNITTGAQAGKNRLDVLITNTVANYVAGLATTTGRARKTLTTELPPSGLLGPVRLVFRRTIRIAVG